MRSAVETNLFRIHTTGAGEVRTNVAVNLLDFQTLRSETQMPTCRWHQTKQVQAKLLRVIPRRPAAAESLSFFQVKHHVAATRCGRGNVACVLSGSKKQHLRAVDKAHVNKHLKTNIW